MDSSDFTSRLSTIKYGIEKANKIRTMVKQLQAEKEACTKTQQELYQQLQKEKHDVNRFEDMSIKKVAYTMISRLSERKEEERKEYLETKMKYDLATEEILDIERKIADLDSELVQYEESTEEYKCLYAEKRAQMIRKSLSDASQILQRTEIVKTVLYQMLEIREALNAGSQVLSTLREAELLLENADAWSSGRHSWIDSDIRDSYFNEAQDAIKNTSEKLRRFNLELTDVGFNSDIQIDLVNFNSGSLFGMLFGINREDRMYDANTNIRLVRGRVKEIMKQLEELYKNTSEELINAQDELDGYILKQ